MIIMISTFLQTNHPILQAAVLKEVTDTFDRRVARDNITNWVFHPKKPGRKDIQYVSYR